MNFKKIAVVLVISSLSLVSHQAYGTERTIGFDGTGDLPVVEERFGLLSGKLQKLVGSWKGAVTEISSEGKFKYKQSETYRIFKKTGLKSEGKISFDGGLATFTSICYPSGDLVEVLKIDGKVVDKVKGKWSFSNNKLSVKILNNGGSVISTGSLTLIGKNSYVVKQFGDDLWRKGTFTRD